MSKVFIRKYFEKFELKEEKITDMRIFQELGTILTNQKNFPNKNNFYFQSESLAFDFDERLDFHCWNGNCKRTSFGPRFIFQDESVFPSIDKINKRTIDYWQGRAKEAKHPTFKARYSGLVWDFHKNITGYGNPIDMARLRIDAIIEIVKLKIYDNINELIPKLKHAVSIAQSIKDKDYLATIIDIVLNKDGHANFEPWHAPYDLLLANKKIKLTPEQICFIEDRLEANLNLLIGGYGSGVLSAAKEIVNRLATHYRKTRQTKKMNVALEKYFNTVLQGVKLSGALEAQVILSEVIEIAKYFNQKSWMLKLLGRVQEIGNSIFENMQIVQASPKTSSEENLFIDSVTKGSFRTCLNNLITHFLLKKTDIGDSEKEYRKLFSFSHIPKKFFLKNSGIPDAIADSDNTDSRFSEHAKRLIFFHQPLMRKVIVKIFHDRSVTVEKIVSYLAQSPFFDKNKKSILECGLRAYLAGDSISTMHVLIPLLEDSIRHFLKSQNSLTLKKQNKAGGYDEKLFDQLLADPITKTRLGDDCQLYLQILFTDRYGFNFRNDCCHGLLSASAFNMNNADLVFFALLVLFVVP